jgi:thiamine biosynthesis lipoprotein
MAAVLVAGGAARLLRSEDRETRVAFPALGTFATIIVETPRSIDPQPLLRGADSLLRHLELETGCFPGQGVEALNDAGRASLRELDPDLSGVILLSDSLCRATSGFFDPTAGVLVRAWGFPESPEIPDRETLDSCLRITGWGLLELRRDSLIMRPGMRLDFGAVAKGYAVDRVYEYLVSRGASSCLVEVGGEVRCGGGRLWRVAVRHPRNRGYYRVFVLESGALATSGDYECYIVRGGVRYSHIINPFTGYPGYGSQSATVYAPTCAVADAFATAAVIGGMEAVQGFDMGEGMGVLLLNAGEDGEVSSWSTGVLPDTL